MYQSNPIVATNPGTKNVHRPNLPPAQGQGNPPNDADRSHIRGAAKSTEPTKETR